MTSYEFERALVYIAEQIIKTFGDDVGVQRATEGGRMRGYCCECRKDVDCEMVKGDVIYPHRPDLYGLNFVRCPICGNYTGKYEGEYPTLPTAHIRSCRYKAHRALDKIWSDRNKRSKYYSFMSNHLDKDFHWGMVRCNEEADKALELTIDFMSREAKE